MRVDTTWKHHHTTAAIEGLSFASAGRAYTEKNKDKKKKKKKEKDPKILVGDNKV